jgi:hypothetical protein
LTEKYTRGVSAVESILVLDRLRQSVAVKEIEQTQSKQQLSMRKTASVPNFSQVIFEINSPSLLTRSVIMLHKLFCLRDEHDCNPTSANCFSLRLNSCTMKAVKEAAQNGGVSTQQITTTFWKFSLVFEIFPRFS